MSKFTKYYLDETIESKLKCEVCLKRYNIPKKLRTVNRVQAFHPRSHRKYQKLKTMYFSGCKNATRKGYKVWIAFTSRTYLKPLQKIKFFNYSQSTERLFPILCRKIAKHLKKLAKPWSHIKCNNLPEMPFSNSIKLRLKTKFLESAPINDDLWNQIIKLKLKFT